MTALHVASERAHNDILEVLQKHGAKVHTAGFFSLTNTTSFNLSCHISLTGSQPPYLITSTKKILWNKCITFPLSFPLPPPSLQVNAVDTLGQTALHRAALAGHIQTCRLLLSYGADPAIVSLQGFTASQMGNEAVQQILNGTVVERLGLNTKILFLYSTLHWDWQRCFMNFDERCITYIWPLNLAYAVMLS